MSHLDGRPGGNRAAIAEWLVHDVDELAIEITADNLAADPSLPDRFGDTIRYRMEQDNTYHLRHLAEAVRLARPELFSDYAAWLTVLLAAYRVTVDDVLTNLLCIKDVLRRRLAPADRGVVDECLDPVIDELPFYPTTVPPYLSLDRPHAALANLYLEALLNGDRQIATEHILNALDTGVPLDEIYLHVFQRTQGEIGRLWQLNHIDVAQEHFCTATTQSLMTLLYARLSGAAPATTPAAAPSAPGRKVGPSAPGAVGPASRRRLRCLATCAPGNLHALGIYMVADILEMHGWSCYFLGSESPISVILDTLRQRRIDVLLISVALVFQLGPVRDLIAAVRAAPDLAAVRIIVGGNPFNVVRDLWQDVGADASARDAGDLVALMTRLETS